jgi:hypothetical protein
MIRRLAARISNMQITKGSLDRNYGELLFETFVNFKMETETKFEKKYIICFQSMILVCQQTVETKRVSGTCKLTFIRSIEVSPSMLISEAAVTPKVLIKTNFEFSRLNLSPQLILLIVK